MSGHITFPPLEPVDDFEPAEHVYYEILCNVMQPDTQITTHDAVQRLVSAFPANDGHEVVLFADTCCEVAQYVPYNHASQSKLITIMDSVLCSQEISPLIGDPESDRIQRYVHLGQVLRDMWNSSKPSEGAEAYINFQSFCTRITERGIMQGTGLERWTIDDIFKEPSKVEPSEVDPRVIVASQCILLVGHMIYAELLDPFKGEERTCANRKQWQRWHKELEAAVSEKPPQRYADLGEEARNMAERALEEMRTIEWKMGVPAVPIGFWKRLWLRMQCTRLSRSWPFWG